MNEKAKVVSRFSIVSDDISSEENHKQMLQLIPKPDSFYIIGKEKVLTNGRIFPKLNTETSFNFSQTKDIFDIEDCNNAFIEYWKEYVESLKILTEKNYKFYLDYEITVFDNHNPALVFNSEFLGFLSGNKIQFSLYSYNNQKPETRNSQP